MIASKMHFAATLGRVLRNNPRRVRGKDCACFDREVEFVIGLLVWPLQVTC